MNSRWERLWNIIAWGSAFLFLGLMGVAVSGRLLYPFELEWQEGAMVVHVLRVLSGRPLYVPPSPEFVPFIYPPGYFYVSAGLAHLIGPGFLALRLVSLVSTLFLLALAGYAAYRETGETSAAAVAVALLAASYRFNGTWFDVGRVDALFLALAFGGIVLLRSAEGLRRQIPAALLLTGAFLTKQTSALLIFPLYVYILASERKRALPFLLGLPLLMGGSVLYFHLHTGGWFTYYVFRLPTGHAFLPRMVGRFWAHDIMPHFLLALFGAVGWLILEGIRGRKERVGFWGVLFAGLVGGAWLGRVHEGGYLNVLMPAHLALALGLGMLAGWTTHGLRRTLVRWGIRGLILLQLLMVLYNPLPLRPPARNIAAGYHLLDVLLHIRGDILIPYHGYLAEMAGKRSFAHEMAVSDVLRGDPEGWGGVLDRAYRDAIRSGRFDAIVLDWEHWRYERDVQAAYQGPISLFREERVFWPVTGFRTRPQYLYFRETLLAHMR